MSFVSQSEICIADQESLESAKAAFQSLRIALYTEGVSPFLSPFITTYSINEYSGINSRDSENLRKNLPSDLQEGLRSNQATLEAWPFELSFTCVVQKDAIRLSKRQFNRAAEKAKQWSELKTKNVSVQVGH